MMNQTIPRRIWRISGRKPFSNIISLLIALVLMTGWAYNPELYSTSGFWLVVGLSYFAYVRGEADKVRKELRDQRIVELEQKLGIRWRR